MRPKKHFTATAYIVSKIEGEFKILLHKHKKHGLWIGIGGHIEKDENPVEALVREVKEETNLDIVLINRDKLMNPSPLQAAGYPASGTSSYRTIHPRSRAARYSGSIIKAKDVKQLPSPNVVLEEKLKPFKNESSHFHIDLIYFATCKNPKKIKINEEFKWFSKKDLKKFKIGKEVAYICNELL